MSPNYAWSVPVDCRGGLVVAADRVYVGGEEAVSAVGIDEREVVWKAAVEGTAHGLAAADGRLYVSTDRGVIYCFGAGEAGAPRVPERRLVGRPYGENAPYAGAAEEIVRATGVRQGYCLDLGCGDGRLAYELARRTELRIVAVDPDPGNVAAARRSLDEAGLYGARVTVHRAELDRTGYPEFFADLIVSALSVAEGRRAVPAGELRRLGRPYGGVVCLGRPGGMETSVRGPLEGAGNWTHQYADPANTGCSTDTAVRGPLGVLWFGDPGTTGMLPRHGHPPGPLFVDGRLYVEGDGFVRCVDGYNGRVLWQTDVEGIGVGLYPPETRMGVVIFGSNICASRDSVYVHNRKVCTRLDGRTGGKRGEFRPPAAPDGGPGRWGYVACEGETLFGTVESAPFKARWFEFKPGGGKEQSITEGVSLFAIDTETGRLRWTHRPPGLIPRHGVAIGGGRAYLISRPAGGGAAQAGAEITALDAASGRPLWRTSEGVYGSLLILSVEHDVLLMAFPAHRRGQLTADLGLALSAFRASDGKRLWDRRAEYTSLPVIVGRTVIIDPGGGPPGRYKMAHSEVRPSAWDIVTGEPRTRPNPVTGETEPWTFGVSTKCSLLSASPNLLLFRTATSSYYDLLRDEGVTNYGGTRPNCCVGLLPAGGLVLCPSNYSGCTCSFLHMTSFALRPIEQHERWALFMGRSPAGGRVRHLAVNLGSTGDRRDGEGVLWLALPRPEIGKEGKLRLDLAKTLQLGKGGGARFYRRNSDLVPVAGTDRPWIYTSGCRGPVVLAVNVGGMPAGTRYRVRLHFAEPDEVGPGERVFDVAVGERDALTGFDVRREAGARLRAVVREFEVAGEPGTIEIALTPKVGEPVLCGLEVLALE
jgi:outer membrane protein assembly factor BamB